MKAFLNILLIFFLIFLGFKFIRFLILIPFQIWIVLFLIMILIYFKLRKTYIRDKYKPSDLDPENEIIVDAEVEVETKDTDEKSDSGTDES